MRILALTITKDDTTSWYRAAGVFRDMMRKMPGLTIDTHDISKIGNLTWSTLTQYDIVFQQRPYASLPLTKFLKDLHIPVWIDYDDNLFEIPQANNRAFDTFSDEKVHQNLAEIAKLADVITVSTAALKTLYGPLNKNVRVVPNALLFDFIGEPAQGTTQKTVLWRGGDSHRMDLRVHEIQILQAQDKYKDWNFVYAGYNPWEFYLPNKKYRKPEDPVLYFKWLKEYRPRVMQVPLYNDFFNHCKSNIAALEGTFSGAVCLVPDWEEWNVIPGTIKYKDPQDYGEKLDFLLRDQISYNKFRNQALDYIREYYDLKHVNRLRVEVVNELMEIA